VTGKLESLQAMHYKCKERQQRNNVRIVHSNAAISYLVINLDALKFFIP